MNKILQSEHLKQKHTFQKKLIYVFTNQQKYYIMNTQQKATMAKIKKDFKYIYGNYATMRK